MSKAKDDEQARRILNAFHGEHRENAMNPPSKLQQMCNAVNTVLQPLLLTNWSENPNLIFSIIHLAEARKELELAIELETSGIDPNRFDKIDVAIGRVNDLISHAFCLKSPQGQRTGLKTEILISMANLLINSGENGESKCKTKTEAAKIVAKPLGITPKTASNEWDRYRELTQPND